MAQMSDLQALLDKAALAGSWTLDPARTVIGLRTKSMWGLAPVKGVFREVTGNGTISADGQVSGIVAVAAASVDTKNAKRDKHLRSADFFDVGNHPRITFTADRVAPSATGVTVAGTLTVRDRTRPVSFDARASVVDGGEARLDAEIKIDRSEFGLTWNQLGMASMSNVLSIHAVFTRD